MRSFQEAGEDAVSVGVYPRKANFSRLERPIGLKLHFTGDNGPVTVTSQDLRHVATSVLGTSTGDRIVDLLTSSTTALRPSEIADALGISSASARQAVKRLCGRGKVMDFGDHRYGVATQERSMP